MRQTQRWIVAVTMAMTMAIPATAKAAAGGRGGEREGVRMTTSAEQGDVGDVGNGFAGWLSDVLSAMWGAVRAVIVPGDNNGESSLGTTEIDLVGGGA
jgi:hypothetical protein